MMVKQRCLILFTSVLLLASLLAGCGGSSSKYSSNSMSLNVAQTINAPGFFPLYVALQEGFFKDQGLTLDPPTPIQMGSGTIVTKALEAGDIEFVGGGLITDAFTLARVDSSIRLLGQLTTGYYVDIAVSKKFEQETHVTPKSSLDDKIKALQGKKIGVTAIGSGTWALVVYLLKREGLNPQKDVNLVPVGTTSADGLAALKNGTVDALSFFTPTAQLAAAQGIGDVFISPLRGDVPEMVGQVQGVFYTKQSVINAKPQAVEAFIRAIAQAETFIQTHQVETANLLATFLKITPAKAKTLLALLLPTQAKTPVIDQQGYDAANQFHVKAGLISVALPYKDLVATDTINKALSS